jgi:dihydropyrimidinase
MSRTTLIRRGLLMTPDAEFIGDLLISGQSIAAVGVDLQDQTADEVVDAAGCIVLPGLVDPHTHIALDTGIYRTPDDWEVGTRTAACGGVTTVIDFATQVKGGDVSGALSQRLTEIGDGAQIDFGLHMMLTQLPGSREELERWMAELLAAGVNSVKVYTTYRPNYYQDDAELLRLFEVTAKKEIIVMVHCENDAIVSAATADLIERGLTSLAHHGRARPAIAEPEAANRVLFLAGASGARPYIVHCSVATSVDLVARASREGEPALAETTPQYLLLDEGLYQGDHPEWVIMQPPLRSAAEGARLWEQLASGAIATIGTDHCDYSISQKRLSPHFHKTAGGIPGLETMLPLLATYGVEQGRITWRRLVELTSSNPARIFGLRAKGRLTTGCDADIVIYDPAAPSTIRAAELHNLSGYTPYEGWPVTGRVRSVMGRGRWLVKEGEFLPAPKWGRFVRAELD